MAMSRGARPRVLSRHASSVLPEKITCITGAPGRSSTVPVASPPGAETANAVAFSTMSGGVSANSASSVAADTGSLSEAT